MNMKSHITAALAIICCSFLFYAFSTGITEKTKKNGPGCECHSATPSSGVTVTITGPDQLAVNEVGTYTVAISGGPLSRGGTNIAASAGDLTPVDGQGLQKVGSELTHILPKVPSEGFVTFQFTYTAPAEAGTQTLFANGNSVNFNGNNTGDQWNFAADKVITISGTTDVNDENQILTYKLNQNYPNPFNPATNIGFQVAELGLVTLKVYDVLGNEISALINEEKAPGEYNINFNATGLTSGIYFYKLTTNKYSETKKMVVTK